MKNRVYKSDILQYAQAQGREAAADLLLLIGYDGYLGSVEEYDELMKSLKAAERKRK